MNLYCYILVLLIFFVRCAKPPDLNDIPSLEYIGISKNFMKQGSVNQDSVIITLKLKDGDGDIAFTDDNNRVQDFFVLDKRTNFTYDTYIIPAIPQQGANNGLIITMDVILRTTCCIVNSCDPDLNQPDESLPLEIYVKDRAGHQSNIVAINNLNLICKK